MAILDDEWDFEKVPENERVACVYYEYGRESPKLLEDLKIWRSNFPLGSTWPTWNQIWKLKSVAPSGFCPIERFYYSPLNIVAHFREFPNSKWLEIASSKRKCIIKTEEFRELSLHLFSKRKIRKPYPALSKLAIGACFEIPHWTWNDEELVAQFREWLTFNRPCKPDKTSSGRKMSPLDLLNHLGAFRYLREQRQFHGKSQKGATTQKEMSNLYRSAKKAERFLADLY